MQALEHIGHLVLRRAHALVRLAIALDHAQREERVLVDLEHVAHVEARIGALAVGKYVAQHQSWLRGRRRRAGRVLVEAPLALRLVEVRLEGGVQLAAVAEHGHHGEVGHERRALDHVLVPVQALYGWQEYKFSHFKAMDVKNIEPYRISDNMNCINRSCL